MCQLVNRVKKINIGNLDSKRDFTFVADTVDAFIKATKTKKNIKGQVINISSNFEISIKKLVELIFIATKMKAKLKIEKKRLRPKKSEVNRLLGSNIKARNLLNWQSSIKTEKDFIKYLKITFDWLKKKENLTKYDYKRYNF